MDLTEEVKDFARSVGGDLVGIASVERLADAPIEHRPQNYLPSAKAVVSIAVRLNYAPIENLPKSRREYTLNYHIVNRRLGDVAYEVSRFLEDHNYEAMSFVVGSDQKTLFGDISHKHVAYAAGLGEFGLNNLLLTPKYGPRVRFASILTNTSLKPDPLFNGSLCDECGECVKICPCGALEEAPKNYSRSIGWTIDKQKCNHYLNVVLDDLMCGLCIKACPIGKRGTP
ncbi:MAG: 4Fe-4S dicluster domain-containing protein [Candidatus Bathyarchaeia archaeon]